MKHECSFARARRVFMGGARGPAPCCFTNMTNEHDQLARALLYPRRSGEIAVPRILDLRNPVTAGDLSDYSDDQLRNARATLLGVGASIRTMMDGEGMGVFAVAGAKSVGERLLLRVDLVDEAIKGRRKPLYDTLIDRLNLLCSNPEAALDGFRKLWPCVLACALVLLKLGGACHHPVLAALLRGVAHAGLLGMGLFLLYLANAVAQTAPPSDAARADDPPPDAGANGPSASWPVCNRAGPAVSAPKVGPAVSAPEVKDNGKLCSQSSTLKLVRPRQYSKCKTTVVTHKGPDADSDDAPASNTEAKAAHVDHAVTAHRKRQPDEPIVEEANKRRCLVGV